MAPICGRPFLEHLLDYWIKQGVSHFVLSVGYRHEVIVDHFGSRYKGAELDYVIEKTPLGTGGGLLLAAEKVNKNEPFLLLNGDTYFAADLKTLIEFSLANDADWCFSLFRTHEEGRYMGMDISPQGQIVSLKSGTGRPGRLANGGVYWLNPRALLSERFSPGDKASLEDDIFPAAIALGQHLLGIEFSGTFIDIGVPDDYHRAPALLVL
jgi:D-glycero-alpha-D-manno-heptose 1-phosphate guanylyltransferase